MYAILLVSSLFGASASLQGLNDKQIKGKTYKELCRQFGYGMGTKVQFDNYLPGYYSMRDLSHDSNGGSWATYYADNSFPNPQYCYGFSPRGISDLCPGYDRDIVKQTMLEHEAIFKNQVCELHRLYRVQRDLMDEFRRKEHYKQRMPYETSSSSSPLPSQIPSEDALKWNASSFPLANSVSGRLPASNPDVISSPNRMKGKSIQVAPVPSPNCSSPKGSEASESRPTKFRRKMLDLQLPANEYIDMEEVEHCGGTTVSDICNHPDGNHNFSAESGVKLFLRHREKIGFHGDAARSNPGLRKSYTMADLNEPVQVEEASGFPSADFLGHAIPQDRCRDQEFSSKFLGPPKDFSHNPQHVRMNGNSNNMQFENKVNGQGWFSCMLEAEQSKDKVRSMLQGAQPEKVPASSQPLQFLLERTCQPPGFLLSDHINGAKTGVVGGTSERNYFRPSYNESVLAAHGPIPSSFANSSDLVNSWDHLSWAKPNNCLSQKSMSVQPTPYVTSANLSKGSQPSTHSNELLGNKWLPNGNLVNNPGFGSELPIRNGFYQGFPSGSRELPASFHPAGFDHVNRCNDNKWVHGSSDFFKGTSHIDMNSAKDLNFNMFLSNGLSNDRNSHQVLKVIDREQKQEDSHPVLPWLRAKGACTDKAVSSRKDPGPLESGRFQGPSGLFNNSEIRRSTDCHYSMASTSCNGDVKALMNQSNECPSSRKILGVPIFEKPSALKNEVSSLVGPLYSCRLSGNEEIVSSARGAIDINMPCDSMDLELGETAAAEVAVLQKSTETKLANLRDLIDLNSCICDFDVPLASSSTSMKCDTGIDLEAPVVLEPEEGSLPGEESMLKRDETPLQLPQDRDDDTETEIARMAAEALVVISMSVHQDRVEAISVHQNHIEAITTQPVEASSEEALHLFADVVCSFTDDHRSRVGVYSRKKFVAQEDCLSSESDYFEFMTLKLTECSAEEYLPKPQIPEFLNVEATGTNMIANRTRKGQARRGRQRRDFQRDILPGLASLSRHEVTEDLQTFGGLMRATGHPWQSGTRRNATRNGCLRGRRRSTAVAAAPAPPPPAANNVSALLKQHLNGSEVVLEDRSLTGWGKTTRRPRRQRCPAGNLAPVALT